MVPNRAEPAGVPAAFASAATPEWLRSLCADTVAVSGADAQAAFAIKLAHRNITTGSGGPFGAAVFDDDGCLVAAGVNRVVSLATSIAHAEVLALVGAQARVGRARLNAGGRRYTLATSAQPCAMCFGAILWAGIDILLIGARAQDVEALAGFDEGPLPHDWLRQLEQRGITVERDLRREDARAVLAQYARGGGPRY